MTKLYCNVCKVHTEHQDYPEAYATICTVCKTHMSTFIRLQSEQSMHSLQAPDGVEVMVVSNTPNDVTFYVPNGAHKGYYDYDKRTGKRRIRQ